MKQEFSAGGIVFRKPSFVIPAKAGIQEKILHSVQDDNNESIEILVCQHSQHHGWVFPKGFIGDKIAGESKEATALRETKEETGITGKILEPLPAITYWYHMEGEKHKKTVYYYIMSFVEGDTNDHDWEMEAVEWLPIEKVEQRLTFPSDKDVWKKAKKRILELAS